MAKLLIEKHVEMFLHDALKELRAKDSHFETKSFMCPNCGCPIRFPIVAREKDVESFQYLLHLASEYLTDNDVDKKMISAIMDQINLGLTIQKAIKKKGGDPNG